MQLQITPAPLTNKSKDRIENMQSRSNTETNIILNIINNVGAEFNALFSILPEYVKQSAISIVGIQNIPTGEKTVEDFYEYDYLDILFNLSAYLTYMINTILDVKDIVEDFQDEMNIDTNADDNDMDEIDTSVELMDELISYAMNQRNIGKLVSRATEVPNIISDDEFDRLLEILPDE